MIEGYLMGYRPMGREDFDPKGMEIRTSQEIAVDLGDMADMGLNEVAEAMEWLGYRVAVHERKTGWLLGRAEKGD